MTIELFLQMLENVYMICNKFSVVPICREFAWREGVEENVL
jgi:hypothetical protein